MYELAQINKIQNFNLNVPKGTKNQFNLSGGFAPKAMEKGINNKWKKVAGSNPQSDANYPTDFANKVISTGVGYLKGSINTQVNLSTCVNALAKTLQNG